MSKLVTLLTSTLLARQARWRSKLFVASTTFVVPADVGCIWVDGAAGGGGGGGGDPTPGGGGGGGGSASVSKWFPFTVIPGETLTITIPAGGTGGGAGADGGTGGTASLTGALFGLRLSGGNPGAKGLNPNGGAGGCSAVSGSDGAAGGSGAGATTFYVANAGVAGELAQRDWPSSPGASGGALNNAGGHTQYFYGTQWVAGAEGGSSGGGGGRGGHGIHGIGGDGGANGAAGSVGTGYGAGGGGGSGDAAGGAGAPGFFRLYMLTAYTI